MASSSLLNLDKLKDYTVLSPQFSFFGKIRNKGSSISNLLVLKSKEKDTSPTNNTNSEGSLFQYLLLDVESVS